MIAHHSWPTLLPAKAFHRLLILYIYIYIYCNPNYSAPLVQEEVRNLQEEASYALYTLLYRNDQAECRQLWLGDLDASTTEPGMMELWLGPSFDAGIGFDYHNVTPMISSAVYEVRRFLSLMLFSARVYPNQKLGHAIM